MDHLDTLGEKETIYFMVVSVPVTSTFLVDFHTNQFVLLAFEKEHYTQTTTKSTTQLLIYDLFFYNLVIIDIWQLPRVCRLTYADVNMLR